MRCELQVIGASATGLHAVCREVGLLTLLQGVTMTIVELSKFAISDIDGLAEIDRFKPGKYHVTFTLDSYQDYAIIIEFLQGKTVSIDVLMVKLITI